MIKNIVTISLFFISLLATAQTPTLGLLYWDADVLDGYTLFSPEKNNSVYLIDNCGQKINEWTFNEQPGATCYILENGNLLRAGKDSLQIRDWDNNVIWSYATTDNNIKQHHDIEPLPNGNILCIARDTYSPEEMEAQGRMTSLINNENFIFDKIIEIQPIGANEANVVWEWKFFDHIIQDFDPSKPNYGIVNEHPELLDININYGNIVDFTHTNAIDYNSNLDQIIISARNLSEIYIIDHSTTTTEAAGHSGGNFGRGGDILWRWGNVQNYSSGTSNDQKLFFQHDCKWIPNNYLDEGKITVFNNGGDGTNSFSSIHIINPEIVNNSYSLTSNIFKPTDFEWSWNGTLQGVVMQEFLKSGSHALPNGNFMICETNKGKITEIAKDGTHLWSYINPSGNITHSQFETNLNSSNSIFRAEKYPVDYLGFSGKDLTPTGLIENENINSENCVVTVPIKESHLKSISTNNPISDKIIRFNQVVHLDLIQIFDINGRIVHTKSHFNNNELSINLTSGIYFLQLLSNEQSITHKIIVY